MGGRDPTRPDQTHWRCECRQQQTTTAQTKMFQVIRDLLSFTVITPKVFSFFLVASSVELFSFLPSWSQHRQHFPSKLRTQDSLPLLLTYHVVCLMFWNQCILSVENNGCLAVKPKSIKLVTYTETVWVKKTVEAQNLIIMNGGDPSNQWMKSKKTLKRNNPVFESSTQ